MDRQKQFEDEVEENIRRLRADTDIQALSRIWLRETVRDRYSYNFRWLGRPIIQYPQDVMALQEIVWDLKPDLIVETGVAHGGSLVFYASMLELIGGPGRVVGIDVEIRPHNRSAIEGHSMAKRIELVEGSSVDPRIVDAVHRRATPAKSVLVVLDSNHTHDHVLAELNAYQDLVQPGGYLVVLDTVVEDLRAESFQDRPWGPGNSPKTAVREFLRHSGRFEVDRNLDAKLLISVAPEGYLRCVGP
jgi:cephalosporin hydroxylase